jgi:hypothetical protein
MKGDRRQLKRPKRRQLIGYYHDTEDNMNVNARIYATQSKPRRKSRQDMEIDAII